MSGSNLPGINYERFPLLKGNKFMQEMHMRREDMLPEIAWGNINNLNTNALRTLGYYQAAAERSPYSTPSPIDWEKINLNELDPEAIREVGYRGAIKERYQRYPDYSSPRSNMSDKERKAFYDAITKEKREIQAKALQEYMRRHPRAGLRKFHELERKIEEEMKDVRRTRRKAKRDAKKAAAPKPKSAAATRRRH
jgi:hypothetical protein